MILLLGFILHSLMSDNTGAGAYCNSGKNSIDIKRDKLKQIAIVNRNRKFRPRNKRYQ